MASNADKHTKRSVKHWKKCRQPVRGHIGPHGSLCHQPSPQFLEDVPSLANIQEELEASIVQHQQDIANLTAELQLLQIHNSTPVSTANKPQMSSAPVSQVKTSNGPNGSLVLTTVMCGSTLSSNMLGLCNQSAPASFPYAAQTHFPRFSEILDMPRLCPQFNLRTIPSCLLMSFQTHSWVFPTLPSCTTVTATPATAALALANNYFFRSLHHYLFWFTVGYLTLSPNI